MIDLRPGTVDAGRVSSSVPAEVRIDLSSVSSRLTASARVALGKTAFRLAAGGLRNVKVKLPRRARKALRGPKRLAVRVLVTVRDLRAGGGRCTRNLMLAVGR